MYGRYVLMSIKPVFTEEILSGFKKFEVRSKAGIILRGDTIIIYASAPVKSVVGVFTAGRVTTLTYDELVRIHEQLQGVTERDLEFMKGRKRSLLIIEVLNPLRLNEPIHLGELRRRIPGFRPPVNYVRLRSGSPLLVLVLSKLRP